MTSLFELEDAVRKLRVGKAYDLCRRACAVFLWRLCQFSVIAGFTLSTIGSYTPSGDPTAY